MRKRIFFSASIDYNKNITLILGKACSLIFHLLTLGHDKMEIYFVIL